MRLCNNDTYRGFHALFLVGVATNDDEHIKRISLGPGAIRIGQGRDDAVEKGHLIILLLLGLLLEDK